MAEHTQGPWKADFLADRRHRIIPILAVRNPADPMNTEKILVASVSTAHVDWETAEANAKLIQQATDLHVSCIELLALVRLKYGNLDASVNVIQNKALKAINGCY